MRVMQGTILAVALLVPAGAMAQDGDRVVPGGGITATGWKGIIDPGSAKAGRTIDDSKFAQEGDALKLTIGPAATYWNPVFLKHLLAGIQFAIGDLPGETAPNPK